MKIRIVISNNPEREIEELAKAITSIDIPCSNGWCVARANGYEARKIAKKLYELGYRKEKTE